MFIPQSDLQLLSAVLVLLWPLAVILPCQPSAADNRLRVARETYFMISLSLMIRLISAMRRELTHTVANERGNALMCKQSTYSLCGSASHCGSWSCWHSAQMRCGRRRGYESRTLYNVNYPHGHAHWHSTDLEIRVRTAQSVLSCARSISSCRNLGKVCTLLVPYIERVIGCCHDMNNAGNPLGIGK